MVTTTIRALERSDVRTGFECGNPLLDRYLTDFAWQNQQRHRLSVTYVAVVEPTRSVLGYVAVSAGEVSPDARSSVPVPASFAGHPPALRIGWLAVDRRFQRQGLGRALLAHAIDVAGKQRSLSGCAAVLIEALPGTVEFYQSVDFTPVELKEGGSAVRPRLVPMVLHSGKVDRFLR